MFMVLISSSLLCALSLRCLFQYLLLFSSSLRFAHCSIQNWFRLLLLFGDQRSLGLFLLALLNDFILIRMHYLTCQLRKTNIAFLAATKDGNWNSIQQFAGSTVAETVSG